MLLISARLKHKIIIDGHSDSHTYRGFHTLAFKYMPTFRVMELCVE